MVDGKPVKMDTSDIAMSPNLLEKYGLKLGDYVDVLGPDGKVLYSHQRIADKSYISEGKPTTDSIELWGRPEPKGGYTTIRPSGSGSAVASTTNAPGASPEGTDPTGTADYFRKRGDQPITTADDPRLTNVAVGKENWQVNKEAAPYFSGFLSELASAGAPVNSAGGWNYREKVGAKGISEHAFGGAIDVNQTGRDEVTPEFKKWIAANPGVLQQAEQRWHIYANASATWGISNGAE
jgi:hypothetical protein